MYRCRRVERDHLIFILLFLTTFPLSRKVTSIRHHCLLRMCLCHLVVQDRPICFPQFPTTFHSFQRAVLTRRRFGVRMLSSRKAETVRHTFYPRFQMICRNCLAARGTRRRWDQAPKTWSCRSVHAPPRINCQLYRIIFLSSRTVHGIRRHCCRALRIDNCRPVAQTRRICFPRSPMIYHSFQKVNSDHQHSSLRTSRCPRAGQVRPTCHPSRLMIFRSSLTALGTRRRLVRRRRI